MNIIFWLNPIILNNKNVLLSIIIYVFFSALIYFFRNLKIAQSSLDIGRIPDEIERQLQEWKRRLCLALDTSNADVFSIVS